MVPMTLDQAAALWDVEPGFLDSASYGPPPRPAWEALQSSLTEWRAGRTTWHGWAASVETSRMLFGRLVGMDPEHVSTGAAVSQLLAPVAAALPDGATVLVPDIEFTSAVFPFAVHAGRGVTVRTAPLAELASAIDAGTAAVAFSAVQSANGEVADVAAILEAAGRVGALTVLDATQAAGWLPLSARDVDVLAAGAYKWLCAPRGTAFATLHPDLGERHPAIAERLVPLAAGWFAGSPGAYYGMPLRLASDARRFDISPAWHSWVGTAPALEVLLAVGVAEVMAHDVGLANELRAGLDLEPSNSAIVSVPVAPAAVDRLRQAGIRFVVMDGRVRLAFHLYNTQDEVAVAVAAITG
jgi:selenocysteine lyase/cysteine desulfurase